MTDTLLHSDNDPPPPWIYKLIFPILMGAVMALLSITAKVTWSQVQENKDDIKNMHERINDSAIDRAQINERLKSVEKKVDDAATTARDTNNRVQELQNYLMRNGVSRNP